MEWILDNLKLVVFVIIIVVYALKAMKAKGESQDGGPAAPTRRSMPGEHDAEEAERTRQIQEEIRRRILARQRGETPTPAAPPPIYVEPEVIEGPPPPPVIVAEQRPVVVDPYAQAEDRTSREEGILQAQQVFQEQLRQIQAARDLAMAAVPKIGTPAAMPGATRASSAGRIAREDLAGARSLRRAIVLREVLGEPVALRTGPAGVTRR